MTRLILYIAIILTCSNVFAQDALNITLQGNWDDPALPLFGGQKYNDCWGYHADGREYAIMGSMRRVHFFDITNPAEIVEVASFQAPINSALSYWRDFKTYGHYAYAVADQPQSQEGLLVFDLSDLPNSVTLVNQLTGDFQRAHNIFVDTLHGRLYVPGSNTVSGGVLIYDLTETPEDPELIGTPNLTGGYVHDIHVRDHIGYASHGTVGRFRVHDFTNPQVPVQLGALTNYVDAGYNHSSWLTEDGTHSVFCDENFGRTVKIANVEDPQSMSVISTFKSELLAPEHTNSIAHNPFIREDFAFIAYYHDGLQVYDISDPENVFRVGFYDTYPENTSYSGFFGAWGTYPFLPSGNVIVSDMINGLFVLRLDDNIFLSANLLTFESEKRNSGIKVEWTATDEVSIASYELQRMYNNQFEKIANFPREDEQEIQKYGYLDTQPLAGINYYRLKMLHQDGTFSYSNIISRRWTQDGNTPIVLYPTILSVGGSLTLKVDEALTLGRTQITIYDMSGATVQQFVYDFDKMSSAEMQVSATLQPGHYLLSILGQNQTTPEMRRFMIR